MTMCSVPVAFSRASSTAATPKSRLSCSMLSTAASRVKDADAGSYGSVHQSRGAPCMGEPLPVDVRVRDDSPLASSIVDPSL